MCDPCSFWPISNGAIEHDAAYWLANRAKCGLEHVWPQTDQADYLELSGEPQTYSKVSSSEWLTEWGSVVSNKLEVKVLGCPIFRAYEMLIIWDEPKSWFLTRLWNSINDSSEQPSTEYKMPGLGWYHEKWGNEIWWDFRGKQINKLFQ